MKSHNSRRNNGKAAKFKLFSKKNTISTDDTVVRLQNAYQEINSKLISNFSDFPLSFKTQKGLKENKYTEPTEIQKESIGCALQGRDILGAAKTGSGKTLAFLIPVLEKLYCKKWTRLDGTGALIITPTRELAYQIFETLRKVGVHHDFSAGLIIGGKDLKFETKRMDQCNIIICTPGRLLQHMDINPLLDCVNLQILVLDEADRCLDMGFEETMNSIIENLPRERQTLLFSATQTKSIRDLARLNLTNPKYISVHENASFSTPEGLTQSYIVCELEDKVSMLWSFIKTHYKHKILVFLSSCKQVKYMFEIFCQLRPNIALLSLYGSLHQQKRMEIYNSFCNKEHAVLFATDIASRGLDFPAVNWVVQLDCPEDATTYIHRVGRTARYHKGGEALLILLPSEEKAMLGNLAEKKIPINEIKANPNRMQNPKVKIEAMLAKRQELKESAQRAFVAYVKSVYLMKDKKVFDVHKLNTDSYARSLGLVVSPRIRFLQRLQKSQVKREGVNEKSETFVDISEPDDKSYDMNRFIKNDPESSNDDDDDDIESSKVHSINMKKKLQKKVHKIKEEDCYENNVKSSDESEEENEMELIDRCNVKSEEITNMSETKSLKTFDFGVGESDSDDEILKIKRKDHDLDERDEVEGDVPPIEERVSKKKPVTKAAIAKRILKKNIVPNKKTVFTDEGQAVENKFQQRVSELGKKYEEECTGGGISIEEAQKVLREEDKIDKQLFKERVKTKHKEQKIKLKKSRKANDSDEENEDFEQVDDCYSSDDGNENSLQSDEGNVTEDSDSDDRQFIPYSDDEKDSEDDESPSWNVNKGKKRKKYVDDVEVERRKISRTTLSQAEELALKLLSGSNK